MDLGSVFKFITKHTPADPVTVAILRSFYELSQFSSQIKAVDEQTKDLLSTTYHVAFNVKEAHRLRRIKAALLDASERIWMDSVIRDTEYALFEIAKLVEPARIDLSLRKSVEFHNKVHWVFKQNIKVAEKHAKLTTCHQSLVAVISSLNLKTVGSEIETISEECPSPHDPQMQRFLDFERQRNKRRSIMSLRSERSSAGSGSSLSSASIMTRATSDRKSGNITTGSLLSLPEFEKLNLGSLHGDPGLFTDETPPVTSSVGSSPPPLPPKVPAFDSNEDSLHFKNEFGTSSPTDYFTVSGHLETSTHASIRSTQAADAEHDTFKVCYDEDMNVSTTVSLPPPSFPGADGLQVYDPGLPYHLPPFLPLLHTCASTSSFHHQPITSKATSRSAQCSPNPTEEIAGSSTGLGHYPHIENLQQEMRRAFSDSSHAPELRRPSISTSLAVSEGARRSMSAGRGGACRAKRSWLTLHASRINYGHGIGWQDG